MHIGGGKGTTDMKSMDGSNGNYTEGVGLQLNSRNFYHLSKYYL